MQLTSPRRRMREWILTSRNLDVPVEEVDNYVKSIINNDIEPFNTEERREECSFW